MTALDQMGHVVPLDGELWRAIGAGLYCVICREEYHAWRWGPNQMIVACQCACLCHGEEAAA